MSSGKSPSIARAIVEDVLAPQMTREIWTGNFEKALPISIQFFDLTAILPPVFYMFRFGFRRGKGKFIETFGPNTGTMREQRRATTIERIASQLAGSSQFVGFSDEVEQAILGDLLLCFCLENNWHALGRQEQVQRVAPAHYMASWIDLPDWVSNLRNVPEMIVSMLANQDGEYVEQNKEGDLTWFAVGRGFEDNVLLRAFHRGVKIRGKLGGRTSDKFDENTHVGLDQLLMIGLARQLGEVPAKLPGREDKRIANQRPIAKKATREFSEDIRRFVRSYADVIPRYAFVELLESCMAVGLTTILTSVAEILFDWAGTGEIPASKDQNPAFLFVDCSNGVDRRLRAISEQSMDDYFRRLEQFPGILMALRLLDRGARYDPKMKKLSISTRPYATAWINMLGDLLYDRRDEAKAILYDMARKAEELSEKLEEDYPEISQILRRSETQPNPVWRLSEALTALRGRKNTQVQLIWLFESALLMGHAHGLGKKRTTTVKAAQHATARRRVVRSLVLTDAVLDYLVHLHLLRVGNRRGVRRLSFQEFVLKIHDRYGFCVDVAPPGITISNELLQANRSILERRLRDLGLLVGVNDAEAMKRLRPRFNPSKGGQL